MAVTRIAYLTPPRETDSATPAGKEDYPLQLARGVLTAAPGCYTITLLSCGPHAGEEALEPGLTRRVLPRARQSWHPLDSLSWEVLPALAEADLVHLFQPQTRWGEVGLLLAKLRRLPVCVSAYGPASSKLFAELDLLELADHVSAPPVDGAEMHAVYRSLLQGDRRAAA